MPESGRCRNRNEGDFKEAVGFWDFASLPEKFPGMRAEAVFKRVGFSPGCRDKFNFSVRGKLKNPKSFQAQKTHKTLYWIHVDHSRYSGHCQRDVSHFPGDVCAHGGGKLSGRKGAHEGRDVSGA